MKQYFEDCVLGEKNRSNVTKLYRKREQKMLPKPKKRLNVKQSGNIRIENKIHDTCFLMTSERERERERQNEREREREKRGTNNGGEKE